MNEYTNYLDFEKKIAKEAGKIMLKYFKTDNGAVVSNGIVHSEVINVLNKLLDENVKKKYI